MVEIASLLSGEQFVIFEKRFHVEGKKSIGRDLGNVRSDFCCTLTNDMTTAFSKLHFLNRLARQAVLGHSKEYICGLVDTEHFMGAQNPMTAQ